MVRFGLVVGDDDASKVFSRNNSSGSRRWCCRASTIDAHFLIKTNSMPPAGSGKRPRAGCRARDGVMQCCSVVKVLGDAGGMPCETYVRFHYYMEVLFGVKRFGRNFGERWGQMAPVFRGRRWERRFDGEILPVQCRELISTGDENARTDRCARRCLRAGARLSHALPSDPGASWPAYPLS